MWSIFALAALCIHAAEVRPLSGPEATAAWAFANGDEFPGATGSLEAGDGELVLRYDFTGGGRYVGAFTSLEPPANMASLRFAVLKPAAVVLTVRVEDSTGQTFQKPLPFPDAVWRTVDVTMDHWAAHFGGADDGILHQPIRRVGLLVEFEGLPEPVGEIHVDAIAVQTDDDPAAEHLETGIVDTVYPVTNFRSGFSVSGPGLLEDGRIDADFSAGDTVALHHSLALFGTPKSLSLEIDGGQAGNRVVMHFGSHFQTFTRTLGVLTGGKDVFTVPVPPEGWDHRGGEDDGVARPPLRLTSLVLERGDGPPQPTQIDRMALSCATSIPKARAIIADASLRVGEESDDKRTFALRVHVRSLLPTSVDAVADIELRDWQQRILYAESKPVTLPPNAESTYLDFNITTPRLLNFVEARVTVRSPGQLDALATACFTAMPETPGDATLRPESPWGMGVYLYRYPNNADGHRIMDEAAALAQRAGVKWSREEFSWAATEPREGEFDFSFYDTVVDTAHRHGVSVYGLLAYWSAWTAPYTEEGVDDFCRWARAVVHRYKDRIHHWEVYNEPNIFFWSGPKELYPVLLERCYRAIKEEDPEASVLGISTAGIDTKFIQRCLDANAPFDILTIHPYRSVLCEEQFIEQLRDTRAQVSGRAVWITEMGWHTARSGVSERDQATLLARAYLAAAYSGACTNVSWYDFRDDGNDRSFNEHNFGVLYSDLQPKPGYRALATLCTTLATGTPTPRNDFGEGIFALQMGGALALWAATDREASWRIVDGSPLVLNAMGEVLQTTRDGETHRLKLLKDAPVFVYGGNIEGISTAPSAEMDLDVLRF